MIIFFKTYKNATLASLVAVAAMMFFALSVLMLIGAGVTLYNGDGRSFWGMFISAIFFSGIWFLLRFLARKLAIHTWKKKGILPPD